MNKDTIAAIATVPGIAGIGIIRISGPLSNSIAKKIFKPRSAVNEFESHRLYLGHLIDPQSDEIIDEVMLSFMKGPHSYTKENVIEINSHSGHILLSRILRTIINEGARLAQPGEFTYRAFINGRIDLTQAEGIVDLVNAKSDEGTILASRQIKGLLKEAIEKLRHSVLNILANVEVALDFPEEESVIISRSETSEFIEREIIKNIENIIRAYDRRKIWMDGVSTVIAGRVNVGKSSLLNNLLKEQRAIVTSEPGTTRDIIESTIYLDGLPLKLIDTAGIRKVKGKVERIGVTLSEKKLKEADLALILIDQSRAFTESDRNIISKSDREKSLVIINKLDLPAKIDEAAIKKAADRRPIVKISALTGEGIDKLCAVIRDMVMSDSMGNYSIAPNLRHKKAMEDALDYFKAALLNISEGSPMDIVAVDLKSGLETLGEITGETSNDDLYDKIFSEFCLGK